VKIKFKESDLINREIFSTLKKILEFDTLYHLLQDWKEFERFLQDLHSMLKSNKNSLTLSKKK